MGKIISLVVLFSVAAAMFLQCSEAQTVHTVGDSLGWTVPQDGAAAYVNWAAGQTFAVGDTLTFEFSTGAHDVVQVPKESFDSCSSTNAIGSTMTAGPANVTLSNAGDHYFICTVGQHCQSGQKLAITVSGSPGAIPPSAQTPPESSSSGVFASFFVSLLSVAVVFLF